ncbi:hypothetical protein ABBQ32_007270 [Trebouxia sp. C0010 RCD-2024]
MVQAHVSALQTAVVRTVHCKSSFAPRKRCCKNERPLVISCKSVSVSSKQAVQDDQVQLGKTGITVNSLAIGAWQWGDISFWGYDTYGGYGEDEIRNAYQGVIDAGLNFVDTAEVYGRGKSEKLLGAFQKSTGTNVKVATKFAPLPWRFGQDAPVKALKASLERMNQKELDLYQIHWPGFPVLNSWANDAFCRGLVDCQKQGLAKAVGVSNYGLSRMQRAHDVMRDAGGLLASDQVQFSLLYRKHEKEGLLAKAKELGVSVIAYSPLAQGMLTGKYTKNGKKPGGPRFAIFSDDKLERIAPLMSLMSDIGSAHGGKTPAQVAINWTMCKGVIPIVGVKSYEHAEGAAGALGWRLSADQVSALDQASDDLQIATGLPFENW